MADALAGKSPSAFHGSSGQRRLGAANHRLVCVTTSAALGGAETSLLTLLARAPNDSSLAGR